MAIIVDQGLQIIGERASFVTPAGRIQSMAVDDKTGTIGSTDTTLGSPTNLQANAFDGDPTRSAQTITHVMTVTSGQFNTFTVKRITLHNVASGSVSGTSASLVGGVDSQTFIKQSTFSLVFTVKISYISG